MKKILLLLSMLMFIFTATVSAASAVLLKNQWYEPSEGTAEYVRVFTTDNPDYYRYINDRFAFAINLPANFNQAFESTNGDGCIFKDEYGSSFTVSGGHNMGMTLADNMIWISKIIRLLPIRLRVMTGMLFPIWKMTGFITKSALSTGNIGISGILIILPGWQTAIIINALLSSLHLHPVGNPAELFTDKLNA